MPEGYIAILILVLVAALICAVMVTGSWLLGPKKVTPYKSSPYECGVEPIGSARERFPIKFYLVGIIFILFDIEVVFLWSWMTVFAPSMQAGETGFVVFSFFAFLIYMATWILGDAYALRVGAFDWDEATSLDPAKLGEKAPEVVAPAGAAQPVGGGN